MPTKAERLDLSAKVIRGYFIDASEAAHSRLDARRNAYRRTDPSYVPENIPHPRVKTPYLFAVKNTKLSWLIRAIKANGKWVNIQPQTFEYQEAAHAVESLVNAQFRNRPLRNEAAIISGLDQGFKYGDHYWLLKWHDDGAGHWGVQWKNLNANDVFPDPWEQRHYLLRRFITVGELANEARVLSAPLTQKIVDPITGVETEQPVTDERGNPVYRDGGVAKKALDSVLKTIEEGTVFQRYGWMWTQHKNTFPSEFGRYDGTDDMPGGKTSNVTAEMDPFNARVTILEYHETAPNGVVAKIIPDGISGHEDLFLQEPTPNPYGKCQIVRWSPYPVDDEAFGYSLSEIVGGLAELRDFSLRASARRVQRIVDTPIKHRRRAKIAPMYLRSQSNVAIPVDEMDDIEYMDPPNGADLHHITDVIAKGTMDEGLGESEMRRGAVGGASSATEASIAEQAGSTGDYLVATRAFMCIEDAAELMVSILRVHITEDTAVPFLGERTAKLVTLKSDYLKHNYWISVGGSVLGGNPSLRLTNLLSLYGQTKDTMQWDTRTLIQHGIREIGYHADEFLAVKQGPAPLPPEIEHSMLRAKQGMRVSPQDDDMAHLRAHGAERLLVEAGAAALDPMDYQTLLRHIAEHMTSMQMKMMMQAQQAMGGGQQPPQQGAQPFMPHEAGMPGQPATYNARTADVNAQRQAPNEGAAPQPQAAPGRPAWARREAAQP